MNDQNSPKARVFISCGQHSQEELKAAEKIQELLRNQGFEPYVAVKSQSVFSSREDIFKHLETSEYFLFIDFKREKLACNEYRGSLWSHQELAIASFITKEDDKDMVMAFCQKGVKLEGLARDIQLNALPFGSPEELPKLVEDKLKELVKCKEWDPTHRNEVVVGNPKRECIKNQSDPNNPNGPGEPAIYFKLPIENRSRHKHARGCSAWLSNCSAADKQLDPVPGELKWEGLSTPTVDLYRRPSFARKLNAVYIYKAQPQNGCLALIGDKGEYDLVDYFKGPGVFILEYTVLSENFADVKACYKLTLGTKDDFKLEPIITDATAASSQAP